MNGDPRRLAPRRRRVIYNDDGDTRYMTGNREEFLAQRFRHVLGTDVDTYFWCVLVCGEPWDHPGLGDANQIMIDAARANDLEIWASVRMNDTHDAHWPAEGLVDLVVMGTGYHPHAQRYGEFAQLCRRHGVPAYVSMSCGMVAPDCTLDGGHVLERFRGRVSAIWLDDIDGIQLFNLFGSAMGGGTEKGPLDELNLVGDPAKLIGLDKLYEASTHGIWVDREILSDPPQRPRLVDADPVIVKIGDPVERLAREHRLKEIRLEVRVTDLRDEESVLMHVNGQPVPIAGKRHEPREEGPWVGPYQVRGGGYWFETVLDVPPARQGEHAVTVSPGPGCVGGAASRVENVQVWLRYRRKRAEP